MKQTKTLKTMLWLSAFFMELTALFFFFGTDWQVINELAGDNAPVFGIEFLTAAILFTIGALNKKPGRLFVSFLASINALCGIYFLLLLISQSWSVWTTALLIADTLFTLTIAAVLLVQLKKTSTKETGIYAA